MSSSKTIKYNQDGTCSVNLNFYEIANIVSGIRPYILLDHYDKNLEGMNKLTINHEPCSMDLFYKLPDLEAFILSVHQVNQPFSTLTIVTLAIECIPGDFFEYVQIPPYSYHSVQV